MVSFEEIQAAYYMVAATGVLVAAIFYILNLRISQKNQEISMKNQELTLKAQQQTLETRQIQLLKEFEEEIQELYGSAEDYVRMSKESWTDFDDYMKKYGARYDPEGTNFRLKYWRRLNLHGLMVKDGIVNVETYVNLIGDMAPLFWDKYSGVILEMRKRFHSPLWMSGFEFLAGEVNRFRVERGWGLKTSDVSLYSSDGVSGHG